MENAPARVCRSVLHLKKMRSRLPRKNPSTSLRLVPLPLGKGGNGFLGCGVRRGTWAPPYSRAFCRTGPACPAGSAGKTWFGPMWASAPTERLPIELRRERRPRRPVPSQVAGGRKGLPYYRFNFPCGGPGRQRRFGQAYIRFPRGIALLQRRKAPDPAHRPGRGWGRQ